MAADREPDLRSPQLYASRELSWLDYNERVLQVAEDGETPLLERVRFCSLYAANLDEFFMLHVAALRGQIDAGIETRGPDGRTPAQTLAIVLTRVRELTERIGRCLHGQLVPELAKHGVLITGPSALKDKARKDLTAHFRHRIFPVLSPLAVGSSGRFPYISNLSLSLGAVVGDPRTGHRVFARVKVPKEMLPRFVPVARHKRDDSVAFVPLEDVIAAHLPELFPGMEIVDHAFFRVTRDADFTVSDEVADLLQAVEQELGRRRFNDVVRVEVSRGMSDALRSQLAGALQVRSEEFVEVDGLLDLVDLRQIADLPERPELRFEPLTSVSHPRLRRERGDPAVDVLGAIRERDLVVHHPYQSFSLSVGRFVEEAVNDPDVLAIKAIVYRTSDDSPLVPALIRATDSGKQAVCVVELSARFEERANIQWARALEQAGAHVVYGNPAVKAHAKCILVVRREGSRVRNYVHVGTGDYNPTTARVYTDVGLFTTDEAIGADVAALFNFLTGAGRPVGYQKALVAPGHLRSGLLAEIERTIDARRCGDEARIAVKVNSLVDAECIAALYSASRAGVQVDVNVRATCCLLPGVKGVSDNVRVVSTVGRFLEHARLFLFKRGPERVVYLGSADLTPRALDSRVELAVPVEEPELAADLVEALDRSFADDSDTWELGPDARWRRRGGARSRSVQRELAHVHAERARAAAEHV